MLPNNPNPSRLRFVFWLALAAIFCLADQWVKASAASRTGITVCNEGVALGWGAPAWLIVVSSGLFLGWLLWWLRKTTRERWAPLAAALLLGGGAANLLDRLRFDCVRDAFQLPFTPLANNLADYLIFIGACALILRYAFAAKTEGAPEA